MKCFLLLMTLFLTVRTVPIRNYKKPISVLLDERANSAVELFRRFNVSAISTRRKQFEILRYLCARLRQRSFPFVGSYNTRITGYLETFTARFQVPYFTWDDTLVPYADNITRYRQWETPVTPVSSAGAPFIVSLRPDLTHALLGFLKFHKWSSFAYVYSNSLGFERYYKMMRQYHYINWWDVRVVSVNGLEQLDSSGVRGPSQFGHMDREERIYSRLKHLDKWLKNLDTRNVVLDITGKANILRLLRVLQNLGMMRQEYHYLILDFGIRELPLSPYQYCGVNISGFQLLDYNRKKHKDFMRHWAKQTERLGLELHEIALLHDAMGVALQLTSKLKKPLGFSTANTRTKCFESDMQRSRILNYTYMRPWSSAPQFREWVKDASYHGITGLVQFDQHYRRRNFSVDLIQYSGRVGNSVKIGTWHHTGGNLAENAGHSHPVTTKPRTFMNKTVRVVSILTEPFLQYKPAAEKDRPRRGKENFTGYCKKLADEIFDLLPDLDYELHLVEDGQYGSFDSKTGTWNGMIGEVLSGKADIVIAPLTITTHRARYVYFSEPFMTFGLSIMLKKPEKSPPGIFSFINPLSGAVWYCIIASCISVGIALYIIAKLSPFEWDAPEDLRFTLFNSMWFSLSAFVQQGVSFSPTSPGARLLSSLWWMFSIVIMAYYTANLAAFLTVERLITPIKSLEDLVNKHKDAGIEFGTLAKGSTYDFFAKATVTPYVTAHRHMQENKNWYVNTTEEGIKRVRSSHGKYAFIMESKMNEYVYHRKPCNTIIAEEIFGNKEYGVAVPKNGSGQRDLWDKINHAVLKLREGQVLATLYKDWWISRGSCPDEIQNTGSRSLALVNVSGVFYILIVGLVVAMFWSIMEATLCHRYHRRNRHRNLRVLT